MIIFKFIEEYMGKLFSKKKPTQNSKIGKDTTCPICGKFFPKKSTYDEVI